MFYCYASFGTPLAKETIILSRFRDKYLLNNLLGKEFVKLYYNFSPTVANFIEKKEWARYYTRMALKPIVWIVKKIMN